jgi:hypothetical protein
MKTDHFFYMIRKEQREAARLNELIEKKRLSLLPGAIRYDKDPIQVSPDDVLSTAMADIYTMNAKLTELVDDVVVKAHKALDLVLQLPASNEREVMILYYLTVNSRNVPLSWEYVSGEMGLSERQARRIRNKALVHIDEYLKDHHMIL